MSERLEWLRNELSLQGGFLEQTETEYESLKEDVAAHGVQVPIVVGEHGIIDGRHRARAALEADVSEVPVQFVQGLSEDEEHEMMVRLNVVRRHMSQEQKRWLVRHELHRDWDRSDRDIARICGVTHPTVGSIRETLRDELARAGQEPTAEQIEASRARQHPQVERFTTSTQPGAKVEMRRGQDGKQYPVKTDFKAGVSTKKQPEPAQVGRYGRVVVGEQPCPHCGETVFICPGEGGGFDLEAEA